MKRFSIHPAHHLLLVAVFILGLSACKQQGGEGQTEAKRRIVVAGPVLTSTLLHLKAADDIVAVDMSSKRLPGLGEKVADLGYYRMLSAEGILSLNPTLIIVSNHAGPKNVIQQLTEAGVKLVVIPEAEKPEDAAKVIEEVAKAVNVPAKDLIATYNAILEAPVQAEKAPTVLFLHSRGGAQLFAMGANTTAQELCRLSGLRNAMDFEGSKPLSAEGIVVTQPDWIVLPQEAGELASGEALKNHPQLGQLNAVKNGNVIFVPSVVLFGYGPETPATIEQLRKVANPQ